MSFCGVSPRMGHVPTGEAGEGALPKAGVMRLELS